MITKNTNRMWCSNEGLTNEQFLARNIAKLIEEAAKAGQEIDHPILFPWLNQLEETSKAIFDNNPIWQDTNEVDVPAMIEELADIQVVLFCMAEALSELCGQLVNVVKLALDKSTNDVSRGVRRENAPYCDGCRYLNLNEVQQMDKFMQGKGFDDHFCLHYKERLSHEREFPHIVRLAKCSNFSGVGDV